MQQMRHITAAVAVFVTVVVIAAYWAGLHGAFFFDDGPSILAAPGLKLQILSAESVRQAWFSGGAGPTGRPVAQLSFALNYYVSGFNPFAFKATNLAIHLVCGALVFNLTRQLLRAEKLEAAQPTQRHVLMATGAVSVLWLLHPIQLLPVLHVVQRMTSLSALFLLAALSLHIQGRKTGVRAGIIMLALAWGVFWPLSVFSKETGLLFPAFVLAWELILRRNVSGRLDWFGQSFVVLAGLLLVGAIAYAMSSSAQWVWSGYDVRSFTLIERLLTEGRVIWTYIGLIVAPRLAEFGLHHDDIPISLNLLSPSTTAPALLGLAGLVWLAWRVRKNSPLMTFGLAWFLIGHAMESTALPLEIAHEHRNYLPLFGILIAAGGLQLQSMARPGSMKIVGVTLVLIAFVSFAFITALRAHQFGDELRRTQLEAQHHSGSARAQHEAGATLATLPDSAVPFSPINAAARSYYERASQIDPNLKLGLLALIDLNCRAGLPVMRPEVHELSRRLHETPFGPGDRTVLYSLKEMTIAGQVCLARSDVDDLFNAALTNPGVSHGVRMMLHSWHADYLWLRERDLVAARQALGKSLAIDPTHSSNRLKWAQLLLISGEKEKVRQLLLELKSQSFSADERNTFNELLASVNMAGE